jgi:hypothetical protein
MEDILRKYVMSMIDLVERRTNFCGPCLKNSADFAWAKLVREWISKQPPERKVFAIGLIEGFKGTCGLPATPLLDYELRKLVDQGFNH